MSDKARAYHDYQENGPSTGSGGLGGLIAGAVILGSPFVVYWITYASAKVLEYFPKLNPLRESLVDILENF